MTRRIVVASATALVAGATAALTLTRLRPRER